ncbi:hypothetical protein [Endozoicomonas arenosclerae]|uniref:hypothetical protein n=1 Tax=Endozoicomonas arenosclerae TaxID=1633495 RepID=UPI000782CD6D|nr:hypothetical protein [Endozoicomonas arenosclerae]
MIKVAFRFSEGVMVKPLVLKRRKESDLDSGFDEDSRVWLRYTPRGQTFFCQNGVEAGVIRK